MQPYFPNSKPLQAAWYTNMAAQFAAVSAVLGFSAAETAAWIADCLYAAYVLGALTEPFERFASSLVGYADTMLAGGGSNVGLPQIPTYDPDAPASVPPGIDGRRQKTVQRIKDAPAYTPLIIGKLLQTENTGDPFDPATVHGLVRSIHLNPQGQPVVVFGKAGGHIDGVIVFMERGVVTVKLGMFTHSPAVDPTPLLVPGTPEERTYTVQPVINDVEVGIRSPSVSVLVK